MSAEPEKNQQQFHTERIASYREKESERHRTVYADGSINEDAGRIRSLIRAVRATRADSVRSQGFFMRTAFPGV